MLLVRRISIMITYELMKVFIRKHTDYDLKVSNPGAETALPIINLKSKRADVKELC